MQPTSTIDPFNTPAWLKPKQKDRVLRISARLMWALLVSLLFHAILFWGFLLDLLKPNEIPPPQPFNIVLDLGLPMPEWPQEIEQPAVAPQPVPKPQPQPKTQPRPVEQSIPKKVLSTPNKDSAFKLPENRPQPPAEPQPATPEPADDFATMIKRRQADRNADELMAKSINEAAAAAERGPSEEERRMKNIMNNLKFGTNGLFQIRRMDPYNASFSFKGWTSDYSAANTQFYEVEAKNGEDIRLVMVRRMIALIREHYTGNFDWVSNRLNRTITLSARPEDSAGLEDFLMKEFFGPNYKTQDPLRY